MGYAYGHLLADEIRDSYYSLLYSLLGGKTVENEIAVEVLGPALDWQWKNYLVCSTLVNVYLTVVYILAVSMCIRPSSFNSLFSIAACFNFKQLHQVLMI